MDELIVHEPFRLVGWRNVLPAGRRSCSCCWARAPASETVVTPWPFGVQEVALCGIALVSYRVDAT